jgi:TonB family protein
LAVERSLAIARGLALGLGAAHAKGVIHRDVKPENVLLAGNESKAETPKLLDFGIAAMKESATAISRTRGLMLTPEYAAPEQWRGMAAEEMDGRVDLYALGGVLYEMLTGQTAFHSHNSEGWMYQHLQNEPQAPSRLRPELGNWTGLDSLVLGLLAKDREQRPRDAAELYGLLEGVQDAGPQPRRQTVREEWPPPVSEETARAETGPEGASRSEAGFQAEEPLEESDGSHREKSGVWRIFAALLALAVIGFGAWFFFGKHPGKPSHAEAGVPPNSGICVAYPSDRPDESEDVAFVQEMPEFFGQMGMSLLQGRSFVGSDRSGGDPVVIVAAAAAKRWWPDRSPIGQTIRLGNQHDWRIIGVVSNPPIWSKSEKLGMEVYAPVPQVSFSANPGSGLGSATGTPQAQPPEAHNPPQSKPVSALDETREKAASSSPPAPSRRVEISPGVAAGMLLQKTTPVYPPIAKAARVSGTVVLQAVISKTGSIEDLRVISGPAMLQQAALDAVRTWRYEPYVMNGAPVEVLTTVNVIFNLGG